MIPNPRHVLEVFLHDVVADKVVAAAIFAAPGWTSVDSFYHHQAYDSCPTCKPEKIFWLLRLLLRLKVLASKANKAHHGRHATKHTTTPGVCVLTTLGSLQVKIKPLCSSYVYPTARV